MKRYTFALEFRIYLNRQKFFPKKVRKHELQFDIT